MKKFHTYFWLAIPCILCAHTAFAQISGAPLAEQLELRPGSILEVLPDNRTPGTSYTWILTLDGNFLKASRERVFQYRLIKEGRYVLNADMTSEGSKQKKQFQIRVHAQADSIAIPSDANAFLNGSKPAINAKGQMLITENQQVLYLEPDPSGSDGIGIDLYALKDEDGDGNPANDNGIPPTSFFSNKRTPVFIWFTKPIRNNVVSIWNIGSEESAETIMMLTREDLARMEIDEPEAETIEKGNIILTPLDNGRIRFGVNLADKEYKEKPLLLQWKFGDGRQSLLDEPIHTYPALGIYNVSVTVTDLKTGEEIEQINAVAQVETEPIPVEKPEPVPESDPSDDTGGNEPVPVPDSNPEPSPDEEPESEPAGGILAWLWTAVKLLFGMVFSIAIGFAAVFLIGLTRKSGGLSKTLQKLDKKLPGDPAAVTVESDIAPMAVEEGAETESTTAEVVESDQFAQAPPMEVKEEAPSWLAGETDSAPEPVAKTPEPAEPDVATVPEVEAAQPAWLDSSTTSQPAPDSTEQPSDTPGPAWAAPSEPDTSAPQPVTGTGQQTQNNNQPPVPSWLESGLDQSIAKDVQTAEQDQATQETQSGEPDQATQETQSGEPDQATQETQSGEPDQATQETQSGEPDQATQETQSGEPKQSTPAAPVGSTSDTSTPAWLEAGLSQAESEGQTSTSAPPTELQDTPIAPPEEQSVSSEKDPFTHTEKPSDDSETKIQRDADGKIPPEIWDAMSPEEKEQEKKRQKRRRYRENRKKRAQKTADTEAPQTSPEQSVEQDSQTPDNTEPAHPVETAAPVEPAAPAWLEHSESSDQPAPAQSPTQASEPVSKDPPDTPPSLPSELKESSPEEPTPSSEPAVPEWLQSGLEKASEKGQTPDSPPPAALQDLPAPPTPTAPAPTPSAKEPAPANENDVQFLISADSVNDQQNQEEEPPEQLNQAA